MYDTVLDISKYQHPVDFDVMCASGTKAVIHRATIGTVYTDIYFMSAIAELKKRNFPFSAYHVVRMDYPARDQIDNFIYALKSAGAEATSLPLVLDCELDNGKSQAVIAQKVYDCAHYLEDYNGKKPWIYSRKQWLDVYIGQKQWLNEYEYWIAYYVEKWESYTGTPELPITVDADKLVLHQITPNAPGKTKYGTTSLGVDLSNWRYATPINEYIANYTGVPETEYTDKQKLDLLWMAHPELHK